MATKLLGQMLIEAGLITEEGLHRALNHQKSRKIRIGEAVVALGLADEAAVFRVLARQASLPFIDLSKGQIGADIIAMVPRAVVEENRLLPLMLRRDKLVVAVDDPAAVFALDNLRFVLGRELTPALAAPRAFKEALHRYYQLGVAEEAAGRTAGSPSGRESDDAPIIRMVQRMVDDAVERRASDIHVEPFVDRLRIRYRIDGELAEMASHPLHLHGPLLSRLKIMAAMDIAERRKPQDGRINVTSHGKTLDIRASVLPSNHGESMVMRILDREEGLVSLERLGFSSDDLERFARIIKRPNGIILVTGPTGSGKTTTLYAALKELNKPNVKIITAEDPVEYHIGGINQVQVRHSIGLTFARILRAMLRQAPNIILVGEIRDRETAEIAIQAALTGHLVFSTLHTNDAPSALARLLDMGAKPFLVSASIAAVMAQRLVRVLCKACRRPYAPPPSELASLGLDAERVADRPFYQPEGCPACDFSGFRGRRGVFEIMEMDASLRDLTFRCAPTAVLREQALASGRLTSLREDGIRKILDGTTTVHEVLRIVGTLT
ncbi:MAG: GspE/PulE family protein [Planctomycetota bacterium]